MASREAAERTHDELLRRAIERSAQFAVRLRKLIATVHTLGFGHRHDRRWYHCPHEDCTKALELLGDAVCDRCGRPCMQTKCDRICRACHEITE